MAHTFSMAVMEILGWPLLLFGLSQFRISRIPSSYRKIVWILFGVCLLWSFSQLIHLPGIVHLPDGDAKRLLGGMPWVLLLWGLFWLFVKIGYQDIIRSLSVILWTTPIIAAYSLHQMIYGWDFVRNEALIHSVGQFYRAIGFFNMPLTFAYVIGIWGCLALGQAAATKKFSFSNLLAIFSSVVCVLASSTRGGWVAFAAVFLFSFFFFSLRQKIYSVVICAILAFGMLQNPSIVQRIHSITDAKDQSNSQRLVLWQAHLEIFKDHPLFGVGYGQTEKLLPAYYEKVNHPELKFYSYAHNIYVQALASGGAIGAGTLYFVYFFFLWAAWQVYRRDSVTPLVRRFALGSVMAQLYFYIGGLTENTFYDGEVVHSLVLIWALTFATYVGAGQSPKSLPSDAVHR